MEATLIKPTVGEGASIGMRADCYPYTIIEVSSDLKTVTVQEDSATPKPNSPAYSNEWIIERNPQGQVQVFTLRKNGQYVRQGETMNGGQKLSIGLRHKYYSYEF